jgi:hypothetical protein
LKLVPPSRALVDGGESGVKGNLVIDPFADEDDSVVGTEIAITVWDDKNNLRKFAEALEVNLKIGPNGVEEVGGELTAIRRRLKNQALFGIIRNVDLSVKVAGVLKGIDVATLRRVVGDWTADVKAELEFDLKIPKSAIVIKFKVKLGVDAAGQPSAGVEFVWEF